MSLSIFRAIATSQFRTLHQSIEVSPPKTYAVKPNDRNQCILLTCSPEPISKMPIMHLSYPEGAFTRDSLDALAVQLTQDATALEKFPSNDWVRSTAAIYAQAYSEGQVYHGGKPGGSRFITLDVSVIQGGYSASTKTELIKHATDAIEEYGDLPKGGPRRVYVIIREVAEANLGFDGKSVDLEVLRDPPAGLEPL
jgi:phenylpyruvate tautomerase PptA (4-oxalocrotonate tautomerase family)